MKTWTTFGLSIAALLAAGGAFAAQGQVWPKLDADGNGVITRAEAQADAASMFARMDGNKDGRIDQADGQLRRQTMKTRMFEQLDANKDGELTKAEFMADRGAGEHGQRPHFAAEDAGNADETHHGGGRHGGPMRGSMFGAAGMADANNDGAITQAEFANAALTRFNAMDANKDGQVTRAEGQAAHAQMKAERQQSCSPRAQG